jgi:hypothetical protein
MNTSARSWKQNAPQTGVSEGRILLSGKSNIHTVGEVGTRSHGRHRDDREPFYIAERFHVQLLSLLTSDVVPPHEQIAGLTDVEFRLPRSGAGRTMHRKADRLKRPGHVVKRPGTGANSRTAMVRLQAPRRRSGLRDKQGYVMLGGASSRSFPIRAFQLTT